MNVAASLLSGLSMPPDNLGIREIGREQPKPAHTYGSTTHVLAA